MLLFILIMSYYAITLIVCKLFFRLDAHKCIVVLKYV